MNLNCRNVLRIDYSTHGLYSCFLVAIVHELFHLARNLMSVPIIVHPPSNVGMLDSDYTFSGCSNRFLQFPLLMLFALKRKKNNLLINCNRFVNDCDGTAIYACPAFLDFL